MNTIAAQLGKLLQAFRNSRGMTQHELACELKSNRTQIALLEQGRRLPLSSQLVKICKFLAVPESMWRPLVNLTDHLGTSSLHVSIPKTQRYLAIAGQSGTGKSTIALSLARTLGYRYLPLDTHAKHYLKDLANNPTRWAFETQLSFLLLKAGELARELRNGLSVILDRTLEEDSKVYAEFYRKSGCFNRPRP